MVTRVLLRSARVDVLVGAFGWQSEAGDGGRASERARLCVGEWAGGGVTVGVSSKMASLNHARQEGARWVDAGWGRAGALAKVEVDAAHAAAGSGRPESPVRECVVVFSGR
jgi:hypothetical protein